MPSFSTFLRRARAWRPDSRIRFTLGFGLLLLSLASSAQNIRYVKPIAAGDGSGSSWANASGDLQAMIDASRGGQVWVAAGLYKPGGVNNTNRSISFSLRNSVTIYGGFRGFETSLNDRPPVNPLLGRPSSTTLSGELGDLNSTDDNSFHVVFNAGLDILSTGSNDIARMDGFVISGGNANGNGNGNGNNCGGGMFNNVSGPSLTNCTFNQNQADLGGSIFNDGGKSTLTNCSFQNNQAQTEGGAVFNNQSSNPTLTNCSFQGNRATSNGGAIGNRNTSSATMKNCVLFDNGGGSTLSGTGITATYNLFDNTVTGYTGSNNLTTTTSPFASPASTQLRAGAGAIDAGSNAAYTSAGGPATDLAGNPRIATGPGTAAVIDMGAYEFQGPFCQPIAITRQPVSGSAVCAGTTVTASVSVTGTSPAYQWYKDGASLSSPASATTASLTLTNVQPGDAGSYSVVVTGSCNTVTSTAFSLTVNALPSLATVTQLAPVCPGQPATIRLTGLPEDAALRVNYTIGGVAQPPVSITTSNASRGWVPADPIPFQTRPLTAADNGTPLTITSLVITGTGCSQPFNQSINLTVNPAPTATLTASGTLTCAQTSVTLTAGGGTTYQFSGPGVVSQSGNTAVVSAGGLYSVTVTNSSGCSATASTGVISNTVAPSVSVNPSATTVCAGQSVTLQATPGLSTYRWSTGQTTVSISVTTTATYSVTATGPNGCFATASATVTVKASLAPPTVLTQSGQAYPGGVASLTVSQNTGSVVLVAGGCTGGSITWAGGNATTLAVFTASLGTFTYPATCQQNGCTSPVGTATVVVAATTLSVSHLDADFLNLQTNIIVPYLQLNNEGTAPIPYGEITVRYWFTAENFAPLTNLSVYYAQLGFGKVRMKYVGLDQPRQGAFGYVEYSFDASAGNLVGGRDSGPIQNGIAKQDYSAFNEGDDYSYISNRSYTKNPRITAYRNGMLVWGQEPALVAPVQSLKVYTENKSLFTTTNTIGTYLQVSNEGNIRVNYGDLKVRYYFTADGTQPLNFFLDYAEVGNSNVRGQLVKINPPLANADTYLELSFVNLDKLYPLSNTGNIQYRIAKSDWSLFNQNNDFSFLSTAFPFVENNRVSVFLGGARVYGTAPGAGARLATEDEVVPLRVTVLGNPVVGTSVSMRVEGAGGQPLHIALTDLSGRTVSERQLERAGAVEQLNLEMGHQQTGMLLLQVSTPTQSRTVKVLKR